MMHEYIDRLPKLIIAGIAVGTITGIASAAPITPEAIYEKTGTQGGLVVHVGWDDPSVSETPGELTAALRINDRFVVHGLAANRGTVADAREFLQKNSISGAVSFSWFDEQSLPFPDDTVTLLVAHDLGDVAMKEVHRVLAPEGIAYIHNGGLWEKTVNPRPDNIDEWTHFLHDSGGNSVAEDLQIKPPNCLRWVAGPKYCRSHEFPSSVNAVVASGGRIFTIFDEAPAGVFEKLPQNCKLIARDAFSGVLLWKVPLQQWDSKYGTGTGNRWQIHHTIPRRLVAKGDRVYVTLRFLDSPVSILDAATGKTLTPALDNTKGTDEILLWNNILIAKITRERSAGATVKITTGDITNSLAAVDVKTEKQLWRREDIHVAPYALAADDGRVVYHNLDELVCLDATTGREIWRTSNPVGQIRSALSTLVIKDGVVLYHGQKKKTGKGKRFPRYLTVLSLKDGTVLWERPGHGTLSGAATQPTEVFVVDGIVWCGTATQGYDLRTGEVSRELSLKKLISPGHHRRCLRGKATARYVIRNKRGAEFVDVTGGGEHMRNDWLRTPCFTGGTPANGIFYVPPDQCFCYPGVKVNGYLAMASQSEKKLKPSGRSQLVKGPAFKQIQGKNPAGPDPSDWPMYRRTPERSGSTSISVPTKLQVEWEKKLACAGTQPIVVGRKVWIAEKDSHCLRCLDAETGTDLWRFAAGARIDSSPTVYDGMVLFGCRDGSVYCLRAADGELRWEFQAAPEDRRIVSYEQVESLWPVQGSVVIRDRKVYFAAGRSSFLNGGIMVYALNAETGELLHHHLLEGPWPDIEKDTGRPFAMEGALPDLFVSDGKNLYMMRIKFDAKLNRLETRRESPLGELDMETNHLVATGGFLDDTGFDRVFWMYSPRWPGFYFAQQAPKSGQLVVFDDETTYAVKYFYRRHSWSPKFFPEEQGYLLFADDNDNQPTFLKGGKRDGMLEWLPEESRSDKHRRGGQGKEKGTGYVRQKAPKWQTMIPVRIRAMVLAGDRLFVAGPPDKIVPGDPAAAFEGRTEAQLQVFSASGGKLVSSQKLPAVPTFDGISAAYGKLFMTALDGRIFCLGQQ